MAYRRAEYVGLSHVEEALRYYGILPAALFHDPGAHYQAIVRGTLPDESQLCLTSEQIRNLTPESAAR